MCLDDYRRLATSLNTPPMFADVLPLIVRPEEVELLLKMSEKELSIASLSELLSLPQAAVKSKVDELHSRGFLKKKEGDLYSVKSFERIVSRHLSEGRGISLSKYVAALASYRMDEHTERARADPYPEGRVLPI